MMKMADFHPPLGGLSWWFSMDVKEKLREIQVEVMSSEVQTRKYRKNGIINIIRYAAPKIAKSGN